MDDSRKINVHLRLNKKEEYFIDKARDILGLNRSEFIRFAISMFCANVITYYKKKEDK